MTLDIGRQQTFGDTHVKEYDGPHKCDETIHSRFTESGIRDCPNKASYMIYNKNRTEYYCTIHIKDSVKELANRRSDKL